MRTINLFLDIGFTLLGGPALSPPKKIAEVMGLDNTFLPKIRETVFCQNHLDVESLLETIASITGRRANKVEAQSIRDLWNSQREEVFPLDGSIDFLHHLSNSCFRIHIISNLWHPFYEKFIHVIRDLPINIATETLSFREGVKKPNLDIYKRAFAKAAACPSSSIMIGDSIDNDILPCLKMGIFRCIWLLSRPGHENLPASIREDRRVIPAFNFEEILQHLASIKKERPI